MEHFKILNAINVNEKTEKKKDLTYLSWAWAWAEVKKVYPDATYKIKEWPSFNNKDIVAYTPYLYDPKLGYMVETSVTIEDLTYTMWLPVMDGANKAMKGESYTYTVMGWENGKKVKVEKTVEPATMFDINKTLMRCLVKNLAMFGLGLYIYAGEDLPEGEEEPKKDDGKITEEQLRELNKLFVGKDKLKQQILEKWKLKDLKDLITPQYNAIIAQYNKRIGSNELDKNKGS